MPLQIPLLDDRNFQQIVDDLVARIPVHTPEWNNFNQSDPGITIVQLFAYMMENLLYRSNRIPEANRLKFLSLLRIPLRPASPGYGLVTFSNERGPVEAIPVEKGLDLYAGRVPFRTRTDVNILPIASAVFYKARTAAPEDVARYEELYNVPEAQADYYETMVLNAPETGAVLPVVDLQNASGPTVDGALWLALLAPPKVPSALVRKAIANQTLTLGIYPAIDLEPSPLEPRPPEAVRVDQSQLAFEIAAPDDPDDTTTAIYTPLRVEYAENVLDMPGIVQLVLPPAEKMTLWNFDPGEEGRHEFPPLLTDRAIADRLVTWIRIRYQPGATAPQRAARLTFVGVNAARVIQALRVESERLGIGTGTPNQVFKVANTPVIIEHPLNLDSPAPDEETFRLELIGDDGFISVWGRVDDVLSAGPDDQVYELDPESGQLRCGDGLRGKRFPFGATLRATYEYGGGLQGQVAIGALNKASALPGGIKVTNPVATWGASAAQTVEDGERSISRFLRNRDRLVTIEDFREITLRTPNAQIGRVEPLAQFDPDLFDLDYDAPSIKYTVPGTVTVMVVPRHGLEQTAAPEPDRLLLDAVRAWLEPRRLLTTRVFVRGPRYLRLYVTVAVVLMPGQVGAVVKRNIQQALRTYLSPLVGGVPAEGAPTGQGWPLEGELRTQDLEAVVARVEGVRYVNDLRAGYHQPTLPGAIVPPAIIELPASGLQLRGLILPWLVAVDVREGGQAADPAQFRSVPPAVGRIAVPVLPGKKC